MEHGNSNASKILYFGYTHTSHAKAPLSSVRSRPAHSIRLVEVCCLSLSYPLEAVFHILFMVGLTRLPNSIKGLFWRCVRTACFLYYTTDNESYIHLYNVHTCTLLYVYTMPECLDSGVPVRWRNLVTVTYFGL